MRTHLWKFVLILLLCVLFATAIFPPREKLKLGKDLAGGVTILYGIKPDPKTGRQPTQAQITQMISVIRDRIDPRGIYDISIEALGTNQIEISMPLPTPEVKEARQKLDNHLDSIVATAIEPYELDEVFRLTGEQQQARINALSEGVPQRKSLFDEAIELHRQLALLEDQYAPLDEESRAAIKAAQDAATQAQEAVDATLTAVSEAGVQGVILSDLPKIEDPEALDKRIDEIVEGNENPQAAREALRTYVEAARHKDELQAEADRVKAVWRLRLEPIEKAATKADLAFEAVRDELLNTSLNVEEMRRVLSLDDTPRLVNDAATGKDIPGPSVRDEAVARLTDRFPVLADQIKEAVDLYDAYRSRARGYDDPKDLIALLRGAGVLSFRITAAPTDQLPIAQLKQELHDRGASGARASEAVRWFRVDNPEGWANDESERAYLHADPAAFFSARGFVAEEFDGEIYVLLYQTPDRALSESSGPWKLTGATRTLDRRGRPAVSFRLDVAGAQLFSQLTGQNTGRQMAIVLDDRIFSAPTIQSRISDQGEITGRFSDAEINYLLKVLNSGSLQAQLTDAPIAQNTVGPKLGLDNLKRGLDAGILSFIVVAVFMIIYYFFCGAVADVALALNGLFILGAMAFNQAAFTMPGIAGIVLTFGMAVDANVLIYERIREELEAGADMRTALRLGYEKAMSSIVDGNVTNLIVCFVLGFTASADVKGFAITLGIGVVSTLFTALFVTRAIFDLALSVGLLKRLTMLPMLWSALGRALNPNIDWVSLRRFCYLFSATAVIGGIALTYGTWREMLDTEFLGGTTVTFSFHNDENGEPIKLPRAQVEQRIRTYAQQAFAAGNISAQQEAALLGVNVFNLHADEVEGEGFSGSAFTIKTTIDDQSVVEKTIIESFGDLLDIPTVVEFQGSNLSADQNPPVYPIANENLGESIGIGSVRTNVNRFRGGVAIVLRDINPPLSIQDIRKRIDTKRRSPEYESLLGRPSTVIGVTRAENAAPGGEALYTDAVVVVDGTVGGVSWYDNADLWKTLVADKEWNLVRTALTEPPTFEQITTISPTVAEQFRATALVSIGLSLLGILAYIWVRFGSFRYSAAAVVALMHDVCVTLGLLALTHYLYNTTFGRIMLIEPFKIDMGVIAALLTIIGYSLNDTIIVMDRIRENRGKLTLATKDVVNKSINATISRTLLTSGTTLLALIIMYFEGGTGIRPFAFAMLCGIMIGTYSSIGVASPMVLTHRKRKEHKALAAA